MGKKFDELKNQKWKKFVISYVKCRNATQSYLDAYPTVKYGTAKTNGNLLLTKTDISEAVQEFFDEMWTSRKDEIGKAFENLLAKANADISDVAEYDEDGGLRIKDISKIDSRIIKEINYNESETQHGVNVHKSVKLVDSTKALTELLKVLKMVDNKVELPVTINVVKAVKPDVPVTLPIDPMKHKAELEAKEKEEKIKAKEKEKADSNVEVNVNQNVEQKEKNVKEETNEQPDDKQPESD